MNLHRDFGITQMTAWFIEQRIREASLAVEEKFDGMVEVDETDVDGLEKNKHRSKELHQKAQHSFALELMTRTLYRANSFEIGRAAKIIDFHSNVHH